MKIQIALDLQGVSVRKRNRELKICIEFRAFNDITFKIPNTCDR